MQKQANLFLFTNDKLEQPQRFENSLFSIPPYYVDRRIRVPAIRQSKCLRISHKLGINQSLSERSAVGRSSNLNKRQRSEDDLPILNSVYKSMWNKKNTQIFKKNLKELLRQYYQIKQKQKNELRYKTRKQRLEQIVRISKSIQQILRVNKKVYNEIKLQSKSLQSLNGNERKEYENQQVNLNESDLSNIRFVQNFAKCFIDQQQQNYDFIEQNVQSKIKKLHSFIKNRQDHHSAENNDTSQQLRKMLFNFRMKRGQEDNNSVTQNCYFDKIGYSITNQALLEQEQIDKKQHSSSFQFLNNSNASDSLPQFILANECDDSVSDKFSSPFQEILTEHQNSNQQQFSHQQETSFIYKQIPQVKQFQILKKAQEPFDTKDYSNFSEFLCKNNTVLLTSQNFSKNKKNTEQRTKQLTKNKKNSKRKEENKQTKKLQKKTYQYKNDRKEDLKKLKTIKQNKFKRQEEKKQKNIRKNKIGLNYAKFIGKLLKLSQNEKIITSSGRLEKFRKINMRQAFLKKDRHVYQIEQKQSKNCKEQICLKKDEQSKKSQESIIKKQSLSQSVDKKCRMTKYEQARLLYNMRNNKFRQLSINFHSSPLNIVVQNNFPRSKRPSFCNLLAPESQIRIKSKRGSFTRRKNDAKEQIDQPRMSSHSCIGTKIHLSVQSSNKYLNLPSQTQLTKLTTFEEFDLQAVKSNITTYLRRVMAHNEKAIQLYNFLMYMQQSRKITLEQQQVNSSLDQFKIQKQEDEIKKIISEIQPKIDDYQGCNNLYEYFNWNQKDILMTNKKFLDKLDARSIELLYWNNQQKAKVEDLYQCSLKEIRNLLI